MTENTGEKVRLQHERYAESDRWAEMLHMRREKRYTHGLMQCDAEPPTWEECWDEDKPYFFPGRTA